MLGAFRFALAWGVVLRHLWLPLWTGAYAVFAFYCLSGFLMAMVLNRTYPSGFDGTRRFLGNRILRIYPPYLAAAALSLVGILAEPGLARDLKGTLTLPGDAGAWLRNLLIIGSSVEQPSRLVPPVWSLHVELLFYAFMASGIVRRRALVVLWFVASGIYTGYLVSTDAALAPRYFPAAAASLPFSTGALVYHLREPLRRRLGTVAAALGAGAFLAHLALAGVLWTRPYLEGFYVSVALAGVATLTLASLEPKRAPRWLANLDRRLGDLAYPVFLCHWGVAIGVAALVFGGDVTRGPVLFFSSIPFVLIAAWAIHTGVERPLVRLRDALRGGPRPERAAT